MRLFPVLGAVVAILVAPNVARADETTIDAKTWQLIQRESGPVNYYSLENEDGKSFVRSKYAPPMKTAVMGYKVPEADRSKVKKVRWSWRALALPNGGDECASGREDSSAVVYLTWKRGLRYYTLKYVWSAVGQKGRVCDSKRNPFVAQDTIVLESGGPLQQWRNEEIDLRGEFRKHFEGGKADADVPDFVGMGLMSDGDQTKSPSSADFGTFVLEK